METLFNKSMSLSSNRSRPGFKEVIIPDSPRSVFITRAEKEEAKIEVVQPGDCLVLQQHHIDCKKIGQLSVSFESEFITMIYGPAQQESPETWKKALHHLLNTYRPDICFLNTGGSHTGIDNEYKVYVSDGVSYIAYWNELQTILSIVK